MAIAICKPHVQQESKHRAAANSSLLWAKRGRERCVSGKASALRGGFEGP
jgi:hypothetical protein